MSINQGTVVEPVNSRPAEMNNTQTWAAVNNLTLNCEKSCEILFVDPKCR